MAAVYKHHQLQMRDLWNKKKFGADVLGAAWFQIAFDSSITENVRSRGSRGME